MVYDIGKSLVLYKLNSPNYPTKWEKCMCLRNEDCMMFSVQRNISLLFPFHIHHVPLRLSLIMLEVIEVSVRS